MGKVNTAQAGLQVKSRWMSEMILGLDGIENGRRFHSELPIPVGELPRLIEVLPVIQSTRTFIHHTSSYMELRSNGRMINILLSVKLADLR